MSKIQWTGKTWNPLSGCSMVSPGCKNCYAMRMAARLVTMGQAKYAGTTHKVNGHHVWTGKINLDPEALMIPLKLKKPTTWFVNSMSDLFHEDVPFEYIDRVFAVMALTPHHTYQILTKRPERMAEYLGGGLKYLDISLAATGMSLDRIESGERSYGVYDRVWPLHNVWLGTSVEDQKRADERIPHLLRCPAAVRFLSVEPLLGAVRLDQLARVEQHPSGPDGGDVYTYFDNALTGFRATKAGGWTVPERIDWVIVGGESGPGARPMNIEWALSIVRQCKAASVSVFMKQLGAKPYSEPYDQKPGGRVPPRYHFELTDSKGGDMSEFPTELQIRQMPRQPVPT